MAAIQFSIEYGWRAHGLVSVPEFARLADRLGYDGFTVADQNPFIPLTQAAAVSDRLLLSTSVIVLPYFQPVMLAHEAAALHAHSNGRLILGVGAGSWSARAPWRSLAARRLTNRHRHRRVIVI